MKIIFLDIDGVLNHEAFYKERFEKRTIRQLHIACVMPRFYSFYEK